MNALSGRSSHLAKLNTCTIFGTCKGGYRILFSTIDGSLSKYFESAGSPSTNNHSVQNDYQRKILGVSDPPGGGQISDQSKSSSPEHVQSPLPLVHFKRNEDDDFVELDSSEINSENQKSATEITKGRQSSAASGATSTGEPFQKVFDSEIHTKSIPAVSSTPKGSATKRDFRNNLRRFYNPNRPALKFVLGEDEEVGKKKKEAVMEKTINQTQKPKTMEQRFNQTQKPKTMEQTINQTQKPKTMEQTISQTQKSKTMEQTINQTQKSKTINGGEKSISIEYVPRGISLSDIRKAISIYGEVVGGFLRRGDNGLLGCHLEFKTVEAKERALSNRWVYANGKQLSVCRVDLPVTTTVRITNLGQGTAVHDVHSKCMSYGKIESLQMREDGAVDVFFSVSESRNMPKLLEKLNEVTLNDSHWIAQPAPRLSHELAETPEGQKWVGQQLSNQISNLKRQLQLRRIYLEDMEKLHDALMHIKECANYVSKKIINST